jgi:hypothetical protein
MGVSAAPLEFHFSALRESGGSHLSSRRFVDTVVSCPINPDWDCPQANYIVDFFENRQFDMFVLDLGDM